MFFQKNIDVEIKDIYLSIRKHLFKSILLSISVGSIIFFNSSRVKEVWLGTILFNYNNDINQFYREFLQIDNKVFIEDKLLKYFFKRMSSENLLKEIYLITNNKGNETNLDSNEVNYINWKENISVSGDNKEIIFKFASEDKKLIKATLDQIEKTFNRVKAQSNLVFSELEKYLNEEFLYYSKKSNLYKEKAINNLNDINICSFYLENKVCNYGELNVANYKKNKKKELNKLETKRIELKEDLEKINNLSLNENTQNKSLFIKYISNDSPLRNYQKLNQESLALYKKKVSLIIEKEIKLVKKYINLIEKGFGTWMIYQTNIKQHDINRTLSDSYRDELRITQLFNSTESLDNWVIKKDEFKDFRKSTSNYFILTIYSLVMTMLICSFIGLYIDYKNK